MAYKINFHTYIKKKIPKKSSWSYKVKDQLGLMAHVILVLQ